MSVPSVIFMRSEFDETMSYFEKNLFQISRPAIYRQADTLRLFQ